MNAKYELLLLLRLFRRFVLLAQQRTILSSYCFVYLECVCLFVYYFVC